MDGIISGIRNIVIVIVASEFLKVFLLGDSFKKYITVCVNIIVIGYIVCELKNIPFDINTDFNLTQYTYTEKESVIKKEYEKELANALKEKLKEEKIIAYDTEIQTNDDYSIKNITVCINENKEKTEIIIKGMKPENYEIIVDSE